MRSAPRPSHPTGFQELIELSRGGMGSVWLALGTGVGGFERLLAVKRPHPSSPHGAELRARFLDEARVLGSVHHANVVGVHAAGEDTRGYYLVLDYVEGETLAGILDRCALGRERLPEDVVLRIFADALSGLVAVHEANDAAGRPLGIVHRDLCPSNLLVGRDGVTRLSDFGISKSAAHQTVTAQGSFAGRLAFLPPEFLRREPLDQRVDVYSLGITLWSALSGKAPFGHLSEAEMVTCILQGTLPDIRAFCPQLGAALHAFLARAIDTHRERRFANARELLVAFEAMGSEVNVAPASKVSTWVERLTGPALDARRRRVAELVGEAARKELPSHEAAPVPTAALSTFKRPYVLAVLLGLTITLSVASVFWAKKEGRTPRDLSYSARDALATAPSLATEFALDADAPLRAAVPPSAVSSSPPVSPHGGTAPAASSRSPRRNPLTPDRLSTKNPYR